MIIIEGTDLTGKTTLAHELCKQLKYTYKHFGKLPSDFDTLYGYMDHAVQRSVQDRFHMSELVYSYVTRNGNTKLYPFQYKMVDAVVRLLGGFTVVLTAEPALLEERMRDGEMYDLATITCVNNVFMRVCETGEYNRFQVDHDLWIHLTAARPFVDVAQISGIVEQYTRRIDVILGHANRRQQWPIRWQNS